MMERTLGHIPYRMTRKSRYVIIIIIFHHYNISVYMGSLSLKYIGVVHFCEIIAELSLSCLKTSSTLYFM